MKFKTSLTFEEVVQKAKDVPFLLYPKIEAKTIKLYHVGGQAVYLNLSYKHNVITITKRFRNSYYKGAVLFFTAFFFLFPFLAPFFFWQLTGEFNLETAWFLYAKMYPILILAPAIYFTLDFLHLLWIKKKLQ